MAKNDSQKQVNIHDEFFLTTFSDMNNARDFLLAELPKELAEAINFATLQLAPSTHQEKTGQRIYSDVVLKAELKQNSYPVDIYVLFEHKSWQSNEIFIQLLSYMTAMWRQDQLKKAKKDETKYRLIIPVVFYHGKTKWKIPTNFHDIFSVDDVVKHNLLNFSYALFDTNEWELDDEQHRDLQRNIKLFTAMIAMKAAYSNNFKYLLVRMFKIAIESGILRVENNNIIFLTKYVSQALKVDEEEFWGLIEESDLNREDIMPTFVETWEQRGVERGIRQGMEKGMQEERIAVAKQMLLEDFNVATISKVTKLSIAEIQKIKNSLN